MYKCIYIYINQDKQKYAQGPPKVQICRHAYLDLNMVIQATGYNKCVHDALAGERTKSIDQSIDIYRFKNESIDIYRFKTESIDFNMCIFTS